MLEKADEIGGTTLKAAFWYWVPNNEPMQAMGIKDKKDDCIRYMARLSRPEVYDPNHPRFGMSEWEYEACAAIYDNASTATELLNEKGALEYRHCPGVPDYWAELPEDKAPTGRVLVTEAGARHDVGRRRARGPHDERGGAEGRRRHPHRPSRAARHRRRRRRAWSASRPTMPPARR